MTSELNEKSPHWGWFLVRRSAVFFVLGALLGAIIGALLVSLAGAIVGYSEDLQSPYFMQTLEMTRTGTVFGIVFGGIVGFVVGGLGFATLGAVLPASRSLWLPKPILKAMSLWMTVLNFAALICYFSMRAVLWLMMSNWGDSVLFALFGVPFFMGIGQIIGLWIGARRVFAAHKTL